jgi:hypothetical protein
MISLILMSADQTVSMPAPYSPERPSPTDCFRMQIAIEDRSLRCSALNGSRLNDQFSVSEHRGHPAFYSASSSSIGYPERNREATGKGMSD